MSLTIRKLLSRKFNNVCLNLAGLLTYLKLFRLPIHQSDSDYEVNNILFFIEVPNQACLPTGRFGINLQLREQFQILTGFPFNLVTVKVTKPKFITKINLINYLSSFFLLSFMANQIKPTTK